MIRLANSKKRAASPNGGFDVSEEFSDEKTSKHTAYVIDDFPDRRRLQNLTKNDR